MANVKWLEDRLRDAVNVCYGGCTHEEIDAAIADNGWLPIETAPSDGQIVIVFGGRYERPDIAKADGDWWRMHRAVSPHIRPTLWQPLPSAPAADLK